VKKITQVREEEEEIVDEEYYVMSTKNNSVKMFLMALAIFAIWMVFTYLLEGMLLTLQRPEAVVNRLLYTLIANIIIGTILTVYFIGYNRKTNNINLKKFGFRSIKYSLFAVILGFGAGFFMYFAQSPPSLNPIVIANAYAQVLVVSIAEILVCWATMGSITENLTKEKVGNVFSIIIAILVSSVLFGFYHFAHSPPFNTWDMVILLTIIGIITGIFYFIVRDIYGTIVFHNFLGIFGVISALKATGNLTAYTTPIVPLFFTAFIAIIILILVDYLFMRRD
jgi:membrane protease YdiL (CAAX protease family)